MQQGQNVLGAMFARRLGRQTEQQKIIEIILFVALVGRLTTNGHNNQQKTCGRNQGGTGEEV
jgi:hypothetical protein